MSEETAIVHGGDRIAGALLAHGVRFLFTLCGGHISPILTGAKARGIRVIDVRHEATAVFAADAVGRLTGIPGIAAVTAGPGLTNIITPLKNAQLAQSPLIVFGGAAPTLLQGRGALQDIDQRSVVEPHVKLMRRVRRLRELVPAVEEAFRVCREGIPGPVFIECPIDVLYPEKMVRQWYAEASPKGTSVSEQLQRFYLKAHADGMFDDSDRRPPQALDVEIKEVTELALKAVVEAIKQAERPLLVLGSQTLAISAQAAAIADAVSHLGIPVFLSGMGRGLLGRSHRLQFRHQRRQALKESDCVLLVGVPCDFRLDYGRHVRRSSTLIAVNRSEKDARLNRRPDIEAIGDAGRFLIRLASSTISQCESRWQPWLEQLRTRDQARETEIEHSSQAAGEFINPVQLLRTLEGTARDTATFVADGGDFVGTASYILAPRGPLRWLDPGAFGTLGVGAGFALGAALCYPDTEIWIIFGDGACGYGLAEFDTFVRHKIPVIALVGNDAGWTQIAREQIKILNDDVGTVLGRTAYHQVAAGFGAKGIEIKNEDELEKAFATATSSVQKGIPVLINAWLAKTDFREGSISM
jgi:acetolactate synthase-1/2/3 large subunit